MIRGARQVLTLQGPARMRVGNELDNPAVLRDASLLIENGRIAQIGATRRLENLRGTTSPTWVDARNLVVIPGFVDAVGDLNAPGDGQDAAGGGWLSRRLTKDVQGLALAGSTFVRARVWLPSEAGERGRVLRQLLRADLPPGCFQVGLRPDAATMHAHPPPNLGLRHLLPAPTREHLRELAPLLAMDLSGDVLRAMEADKRLPLLRSAAQSAPCVVSGVGEWTVRELLDLSLVIRFQAEGVLPDDASAAQLAQWGFPWLAYAGCAALDGEAWVERVPRALEQGLALALATGYRRDGPGVLSPLGLLALLRQRTGLGAAQLLQLQIANTAHALGVGDRMGSLETGKEANLLLVDCEDYRELGLQIGAPRVVAVYRRGQLVKDEWMG
ncbi:MAG: amidohydrolase family protein [Bryobacterales bacterium]|nr:amidohydrolase family protein [Bryobacterales bacterium]